MKRNSTDLLQKSRLIQWVVGICILLLVPATLTAGDLKDLIKKVEVDGEVAIGLEYNEWLMPLHKGDKVFSDETVRIGKLEADFKISPTKKLFFAFDLGYDIEDHAVDVDKLYAGAKLSNQHQLRLGYMKKRFGIEGSKGATTRTFAHRSILYDYIKSFHVLGHDLILYYRKKAQDPGPFQGSKFWFGVGGDASKRYFGLASTELEVPNFDLNAGFMYVNAMDSYEKIHYFLITMGADSEFKGKYQFEFELTAGLDPSATAMEDELGTDKSVYFSGIRFQNSVTFKTGRTILSAIEPAFESSYLWRDLGTDKGEIQVRPGINIGFGEKRAVRLILNSDIRFAKSSEPGSDFAQSYDGFLTEVQIKW